jgi:hypothetical protein
MEEFDGGRLEERFARFERAAVKGHEESIWIGSVVNSVEMEKSVLMEAFAQTEEPMGWYFAGLLSDGREQFEFLKKSAEGGCSWGQVWYGYYFRYGRDFVEKDEKVYEEWLEKAAKQNKPLAMYWLGDWFRDEGGDKQKAVSYFRAAAELGWKDSMKSLAEMLRNGEGCEKDLRQAAIWGAKGDSDVFWHLLGDAGQALKSGATEDLGCDFNQLCYSLGWGMYWYMYSIEKVTGTDFINHLLDYYCSCVELQQKSIFSFLLCWNRTTGVKGPGQMIAQIVWEAREDNLVKKSLGRLMERCRR